MRLGRFRQPLHEHLSEQLNPDRSLRALLYLAALYHDSGKPRTSQADPDGRIRFLGHERLGEELARARGGALRLSNLEIERLAGIVRHHLRPLLLAQTPALPSRRAVYRFFRDTGAAGVEICLLSLADTLSTYRTTLPQETWLRQIDVVRRLLEAWWEKREEEIAPPALVNGTDLQRLFQLEPGPLIGQLLEAIREAQAAGELHERQEALDFVRARLPQG
jgi:putative nucleotidyltransferase with HDIG domain